MAHDPIDTLGKATRHNMLVKAECSCGNVRYCRYFFSGDPPGHRPLASGPRDRHWRRVSGSSYRNAPWAANSLYFSKIASFCG
ncbi:MAG: hypothetical protein EOS18_15415 [Mesorhizobium sp.]|nr:MAG: hypothetical protein EOS18_15415 [Mesorhizobium sp.]TIL44755.1 MAG: hypothetical protein E5Y86_14850 [Mesorhizobium sp.]